MTRLYGQENKCRLPLHAAMHVSSTNNLLLAINDRSMVMEKLRQERGSRLEARALAHFLYKLEK